ncbi:MAG: hypothetical protein DWC07_01580 [Candidatus Poseidoniales archaeon]|nr:MAG: hypothetical protein DWC07_01580 [Candidatus Poseidoniales archaeon]
MMDGEVRDNRVTMSKRYIARDPRTGKPIQSGPTTVRNEISYEATKGPWLALSHEEIMDLAEGSKPSCSVYWMGQEHQLGRCEGLLGLSSVRHNLIGPAHRLLLSAFEDSDAAIRKAGLTVLPEFAVRRSDELFDWLSVLLDDPDPTVQRAASNALARAAPTFPSGVRSSLEIELRSSDKHRQKCAWDGLNALADTWPDVVADHVDTLLLEPDAALRRRAAKMLRKIIARKTSVVWDLVSWALNDEDVVVRRTAAKTIAQLASHDVRMATMFAERAIGDADAEVRLSAIKAIQKLNRGHGRARDLILAGSRSLDVRVRRACVSLLPKMLSEDELRGLVDDLLKTETDEGLVKQLMDMRFDASLEGTEAEKNAALAPALPVPQIDREVMHAQGKAVGLLNDQPTTPPAGGDAGEDAQPGNPPRRFSEPLGEPVEPTLRYAASSQTARPSQDEIMGYHDDDEPDLDDDER